MPPSLLDWLPEDHLVWSILGSVEELDLSAFYADYRADGHGRPAYDPKMMVALLLYSYARGNWTIPGWAETGFCAVGEGDCIGECGQ